MRLLMGIVCNQKIIVEHLNNYGSQLWIGQKVIYTMPSPRMKAIGWLHRYITLSSSTRRCYRNIGLAYVNCGMSCRPRALLPTCLHQPQLSLTERSSCWTWQTIKAFRPTHMCFQITTGYIECFHSHHQYICICQPSCKQAVWEKSGTMHITCIMCNR